MSKTIEQIATVPRFDPISVLNRGAALKGITTGQRPLADILKSMLTSLSEGRITDFVAPFQAPFKFTDHALNLEFNEPQQLTKFLEKSRELFPDTVIEVISVFQSGDRRSLNGSLRQRRPNRLVPGVYRGRIALRGSTVVETRHGTIIRWSDYYDQIASRRTKLGAFFEQWIEY